MKSKFLAKLKAWFKSHSQKHLEAFKSHWEAYEVLPPVIPTVEAESTHKRNELNALSHETQSQDPHIADLSSHYSLPTLITCVATEETSDVNQRITHYPPSNALH